MGAGKKGGKPGFNENEGGGTSLTPEGEGSTANTPSVVFAWERLPKKGGTPPKYEAPSKYKTPFGLPHFFPKDEAPPLS